MSGGSEETARVLLELSDELRRRATEHRAEYPGAYADGLEDAADAVADKARDLLVLHRYTDQAQRTRPQYEPGELAQPGTYGPEVLDRG